MTEERDLSVIIQNYLECSSHCVKLKTADRVVGMIKRTFSVRDKRIILQLYKSLVRPYLEYSVGIEASLSAGYLSVRRADKLISTKDKTCEDRLSCLKLTTLETMR